MDEILKKLLVIEKCIESISKHSNFRRLNVRQTAHKLGLSPKTIYNELSLGTFPIKCKRIRGSVGFLDKDIDEYLMNL